MKPAHEPCELLFYGFQWFLWVLAAVLVYFLFKGLVWALDPLL